MRIHIGTQATQERAVSHICIYTYLYALYKSNTYSVGKVIVIESSSLQKLFLNFLNINKF